MQQRGLRRLRSKIGLWKAEKPASLIEAPSFNWAKLAGMRAGAVCLQQLGKFRSDTCDCLFSTKLACSFRGVVSTGRALKTVLVMDESNIVECFATPACTQFA